MLVTQSVSNSVAIFLWETFSRNGVSLYITYRYKFMGSEVKMDPIILAALTTYHTSKLLSFNGALLITTRTRQECSNIRLDEI